MLDHFASQNVITLAELRSISSVQDPTEKVRKLLNKISGPLESGGTSSFYKLLVIMKRYGNDATKQLAVEINKSLQHQFNPGKLNVCACISIIICMVNVCFINSVK